MVTRTFQKTNVNSFIEQACKGFPDNMDGIFYELFQLFTNTSLTDQEKETLKDRMIQIGTIAAKQGHAKIAITTAKMYERRGQIDEALACCQAAQKHDQDDTWKKSLKTVITSLNQEVRERDNRLKPAAP